MRVPAVALVALFLAAPLSGCFGDDPPDAARSFRANGGSLTEGWAYDGAGYQPVQATLTGQVDQTTDTGSVASTFSWLGSSWRVEFGEFRETAPFHAGGIVFDLVEHGDSGVADASIPRILATIAAWGSARVYRDEVLVTGTGGLEMWNAHLMVSDTTVRTANGRILKADGSGPYSPSAPGDALRAEGDPQAFLVLRGPDGDSARREPVATSETLAFAGAESTQAVEVPAGPWTMVALNVTLVGAPVGVGQYSVRVLDGTGTVVGEPRAGNLVGVDPVVIPWEFGNAPGPLSVEIRGVGAFSARVDAMTSYDDRPFIVLTWDDVAWARA